jgi:hypothetical protein
MTLADRILQLRAGIIDVENSTISDYPAVREAVLLAGGPGFAEGIELCMAPYYDVAYGEDEFGETTEIITLVTPTASDVSAGTLVAVLKSMLQIALATQWLNE